MGRPTSLRLSVIVPATKRTPTLDRCLGALAAAANGPDETIVVDRPAGAGPAAARNDGAQRAKGEIVVFVDADVLVHPDAFTRIRAAFARDPHLVALFGSYDDRPEDPGVVSGFRNLLHHHVHKTGAGEASTFWAGLGAIRRTALMEIGGYDAERFPRPSVEDVELGMRLRDAGARIMLDPELQGMHLKRWTLGKMVATDLRQRGAPWTRLLLQRRRSSRALNLSWRHRLSALAALALIAGAILLEPIVVLAALAALLALNWHFYLLLIRRRGPLQALAGIGLHVVHLLTAVAAVPVGLVEQLVARRRRQLDHAALTAD